jgi:hypothetical protein
MPIWWKKLALASLILGLVGIPTVFLHPCPDGSISYGIGMLFLTLFATTFGPILFIGEHYCRSLYPKPLAIAYIALAITGASLIGVIPISKNWLLLGYYCYLIIMSLLAGFQLLRGKRATTLNKTEKPIR